MNQLLKIFSLSFYQWYLLISAMIFLPIIRLSLNVLGFKKTYNTIINSGICTHSQTELDDKHILEAQTIARMINIAATYGAYRANCLPKSLLLLLALKKRNISCQLMIGMNEQRNIEEKHFVAHAWVESKGNTFNDQSGITAHFKTFQLPSGLL